MFTIDFCTRNVYNIEQCTETVPIMNNFQFNYLDQIIQAALKAAEEAGLKGRIEKYAPAGQVDANITFTINDRTYNYTADIKNVDRVAVLKRHLHAKDEIVVAPYITAQMADYCIKNGIQFMDAAGNIYFKQEGVHLQIVGRKRALPAITMPVDRANTGMGLRVVFALLCDPALLNAPYRDIAAAAGVALGTVGWVFYAMAHNGDMLAAKGRNRRLVEPRRMLDEWTMNYPLRLRPKLGAQRFRGTQDNWWKNDLAGRYNALLGGEAAGELLTNYRKAADITIYVNGDPAKLIIDNKLKADPHGEIEILPQFWHFEAKPPVPGTVPPLLAYADLMAAPDPRDRELAKLIYERYLANA